MATRAEKAIASALGDYVSLRVSSVVTDVGPARIGLIPYRKDAGTFSATLVDVKTGRTGAKYKCTILVEPWTDD